VFRKVFESDKASQSVRPVANTAYTIPKSSATQNDENQKSKEMANQMILSNSSKVVSPALAETGKAIKEGSQQAAEAALRKVLHWTESGLIN